MLTCPHCSKEVRINTLPHQGWFNHYRICPDCGGRFTVDAQTRRLQAICILIAIISLALTILLYFDGTAWLLPAISSYVILGLIIFWGNRRVFLVPYK